MEIHFPPHRYDKTKYRQWKSNVYVEGQRLCPKCFICVNEDLRKHKRGIQCKSNYELRQMIESGYAPLWKTTQIHSNILYWFSNSELLVPGKYRADYFPALLLSYFRFVEDNMPKNSYSELGEEFFVQRRNEIRKKLDWFIGLSKEEQENYLDGEQLVYEIQQEQRDYPIPF